jgi:hypothetical protein
MEMTTLLTPHSKLDCKIRADVYAEISMFIIQSLKEKPEITVVDLLTLAEQKESWNFHCEFHWYFLKVKQDLEARKIIKVQRGLRKVRLHTIRLLHYKTFEKMLKAQTKEGCPIGQPPSLDK